MATYGTLVLPAANRVYAQASPRLLQAELGVFNRTVLGDSLSDIREETVGGVPYVCFEADELSERDIAYLSNLSSCYALFQILEENCLRPIELHRLDRFDDDLISIQKYPGKTNEHFTKLLVNVALLSSRFASEMLDRKFSLIDPLCGRGTTLNQALMYGFDATGLDIDKKDFQSYSTFIQTYLKRAKLKHKAHMSSVRRNGKQVAQKLEVTLSESKEKYKSGDTLDLAVFNADTLKAAEIVGKAKYDILVADAPYGVQHGSRTSDQGLARSPIDLLKKAAPIWAGLLRTGGAMAIAWNVRVADRGDVEIILKKAGLEVLAEGPYLELEHWVEQAITRDVIVARKP